MVSPRAFGVGRGEWVTFTEGVKVFVEVELVTEGLDLAILLPELFAKGRSLGRGRVGGIPRVGRLARRGRGRGCLERGDDVTPCPSADTTLD